MRFLPLLLMSFCMASAQTSTSKLLEQGLKQAVAGFAPVPAQDRAAVLEATARLLMKHVTFRPDGTASSYYASGDARHPVEWRKLVVSHITLQAVTEADRLNGIVKRYLVSFGCDAHRSWDTKTNRWSQWYPIGSPTFPSAVYFEMKNGAWTARESFQLKFFTPGPGPSIAAPERNGKDAGLPPGMTRGK